MTKTKYRVIAEESEKPQPHYFFYILFRGVTTKRK